MAVIVVNVSGTAGPYISLDGRKILLLFCRIYFLSPEFLQVISNPIYLYLASEVLLIQISPTDSNIWTCLRWFDDWGGCRTSWRWALFLEAGFVFLLSLPTMVALFFLPVSEMEFLSFLFFPQCLPLVSLPTIMGS